MSKTEDSSLTKWEKDTNTQRFKKKIKLEVMSTTILIEIIQI